MAATSRQGLKALERIKTPLIDRATLEKLLRVYAASRSISSIASVATKPGRTTLIDRGLLAQRLGKIAAGEVYFFETKRRERLGNQLTEINRDLAQRRSKLEITCIYALDLLRQLMELAQASGGTLV